MNVKLLIDAVMQQTTVLIGQLSTAAGIRAPLARIADQVFIDLARELEAQGVGRRVAADMFGLALRSYQKKVRRILESESVPEHTLWEAVLRYVRREGQTTRRSILRAFRADAEREIGAVLNDLVSSGLLYQTGHGRDSLYGTTSATDLQRLAEDGAVEASVPRVWGAVLERGQVGRDELKDTLGMPEATFEAVVTTLLDEGKLVAARDNEIEVLKSADLLIPVGASVGWELAVYDHFRAVVNALAAKVRKGQARARSDDVVGGATLSFQLTPSHPLEGRVLGLLADVRDQVNALWKEVEAENRRRPPPRSEDYKVYFYFGQYVEDVAWDSGRDEVVGP